MGVVNGISANEYPRQGTHGGKRARVLFNYGTGGEFPGTIVRDDMTAPFVGIIKLDDGRYILTTECQYAPMDESDPDFVPWQQK